MQKISFDLDIYPYQVDFMGHVNNSVYIHWMEIGRTKLLEAVGMPLHVLLKQGFGPVLTHTSITYKAPLHLGDRVHIELWLAELRNASAKMQFHILNTHKAIAAEGIQKGLFVNINTMRPRRFLPEERAVFLPYLATDDTATRDTI